MLLRLLMSINDGVPFQKQPHTGFVSSKRLFLSRDYNTAGKPDVARLAF